MLDFEPFVILTKLNNEKKKRTDSTKRFKDKKSVKAFNDVAA